MTLQLGLGQTTGRMFNALHMCLIPKGPHRGKVLVWGNQLVLAKTPGFAPQGPNDWYSLQPWAIVDPDPPAGGIQFENFFLPIEPSVFTGGVVSSAPNLFCAGHAWSPYGDLVVVGGTTWSVQGGLLGATLTYVFNPAEPSAPFPSQTPSLYTGSFGHWVSGPPLEYDRWYPTATLTSRLTRLQSIYPNEGDTILVAGGSLQFNSPGPDSTWNSYEALRFTGPSSFGVSGIEADYTGPPLNPVFTWDGPGTTTPVPLIEIDWLHEYPRLHQLTNGRVFFSGYAQRGAMLDHEAPGTWYKSPAQPVDASGPITYSSNWHEIRHDGCSVLMPAVNGVTDAVMRVGGGNHSPGTGIVDTTPTAEIAVGGGFWNTAPSLPTTNAAPDGGRMFANLLPLPTGALLMLGGQNYQSSVPTPMTSPLIYADGSWHVDGPDPIFPVRRNYHSTAVLLPDGRVMIGGGDDREIDYEIYNPYYRLLPVAQRPTNVQFQSPVPPTDPFTGSLKLQYGTTYGMLCSIIDDASSVARVALTSPGAMTHHSDMHARHVHLRTTTQSSTSFTITTPADDRQAPRGVYMLWVITNTGAVSDATWVVLR